MKDHLKAYSIGLLLLQGQVLAADATIDLSTTGGASPGFFAGITQFMQDFINFVGGPGVLFVTFMCIVGAVGLFVAAPKQASGAIGWLLRAIAGGVVILNAAIVITYLQGLM